MDGVSERPDAPEHAHSGDHQHRREQAPQDDIVEGEGDASSEDPAHDAGDGKRDRKSPHHPAGPRVQPCADDGRGDDDCKDVPCASADRREKKITNAGTKITPPPTPSDEATVPGDEADQQEADERHVTANRAAVTSKRTTKPRVSHNAGTFPSSRGSDGCSHGSSRDQCRDRGPIDVTAHCEGVIAAAAAITMAATEVAWALCGPRPRSSTRPGTITTPPPTPKSPK